MVHMGFEKEKSPLRFRPVLDLCTKKISASTYTWDWKDVTCKKCLAKKGKKK